MRPITGTSWSGWLNISEEVALFVAVSSCPDADRRVVLVHSAGGSSASWDPAFITALQRRRFEVLCVDLRDSGRSTYDSAPYGVRDLATDLAAVLDQLEWPVVTVLGVSAGAAIAEAFARTEPARCANVVLVAPLQADPSDRARAAAAPNPAAVTVRDGFGRLVTAEPEACVQYLVQYARALSGEGFTLTSATRTASTVLQHSAQLAAQLTRLPALTLSAMLDGEVTCPVLVVQGSNDPVLPLASVSRWISGLPRARLLLVAGGGHGDLPSSCWPVLLDAMQVA